MTSFLRSFWGSLVMLIALLVIVEHSGGVSNVLKSTTGFVTGTVGAFKT